MRTELISALAGTSDAGVDPKPLKVMECVWPLVTGVDHGVDPVDLQRVVGIGEVGGRRPRCRRCGGLPGRRVDLRRHRRTTYGCPPTAQPVRRVVHGPLVATGCVGEVEVVGTGLEPEHHVRARTVHEVVEHGRIGERAGGLPAGTPNFTRRYPVAGSAAGHVVMFVPVASWMVAALVGGAEIAGAQPVGSAISGSTSAGWAAFPSGASGWVLFWGVAVPSPHCHR